VESSDPSWQSATAFPSIYDDAVAPSCQMPPALWLIPASWGHIDNSPPIGPEFWRAVVAVLPPSLIFGALYQVYGALVAFRWGAALAVLAVVFLVGVNEPGKVRDTVNPWRNLR
jgi:hypothetical protein